MPDGGLSARPKSICPMVRRGGPLDSILHGLLPSRRRLSMSKGHCPRAFCSGSHRALELGQKPFCWLTTLKGIIRAPVTSHDGGRYGVKVGRAGGSSEEVRAGVRMSKWLQHGAVNEGY